MAKFNRAPERAKTVNKEGHAAYAMTDKDRLVTQVLTTFFAEPKFYGDNSGEIIDAAKRMAADDPAFVAKLAVFARREFNMRSVSHVLTAILAHELKGKAHVRGMIPAVVVRADDMTEILSAYLTLFGKPFPNSLKRGIADAFARFDEYAIAKYKGERDALRMRDVLRICHPAPKDETQSAMWKRCIAGELEPPMTWETELSKNGNNKGTWEKLIDSGKVGYMALLRNLRNIVNAAPDNIGAVFGTISNADNVRKSGQFPFRFYAAYKELLRFYVKYSEPQRVPGAASAVFDALETAIEASVANMRKIPGRTAVAVDVSGSMSWNRVSARSGVSCAEIALLLGVLAVRICEESVFMTFDTDLYKPAVSTKGGILAQAQGIPVNGGGTNMELPFRHLIEESINVDRVIVLSDNEINGDSDKTVQSLADEYRGSVNKDCWVHGVDLQGYGTQQFVGGRTNIIAGWSEKVLEFIALAEAGTDSLTKRIEAYEYAVA